MTVLRLAYVALFLLALIAVLVLWSEVGGVDHFDLLPWHIKLVLSAGAAFACAKAAAAAVAEREAWNRRTLAWCALLVALLIGCGLASWYSHLYLETDQDEDQSPASLHAAVLPATNPPPSAI